VPAVVQDARSGRVLTVAYMNRDALERTLAEEQTWFWSRSRAELWHKGATSGNVQRVRGVVADCDADALLILVDPDGPACHTGARTCFFTRLAGDQDEPFAALADLAATVSARAAEADPSARIRRACWPAASTQSARRSARKRPRSCSPPRASSANSIYESADLLYHLTVLWQASGVGPEEVAAELARRQTPRASTA